MKTFLEYLDQTNKTILHTLLERNSISLELLNWVFDKMDLNCKGDNYFNFIF